MRFIFILLFVVMFALSACSESPGTGSSGKTMKELGMVPEKDVPEGTTNDTYDINATHKMSDGYVIKKPTVKLW